MPITYMCTVFVFILGTVLLHEKIFLTDILGAGLIIGYQLYNFFYPPGKQVNLELIEYSLPVILSFVLPVIIICATPLTYSVEIFGNLKAAIARCAKLKHSSSMSSCEITP